MNISNSGIWSKKKGGPVLDSVSINLIAGAWSFRKLISSYTGNANRVVRTSDNTPFEIGFAGIDYDEDSLDLNIGSNSATMDLWYDQTSAGITLSQSSSSNRPRIVNAGVTDNINGKVSAFYNGTSSHLLSSTLITGIVNNSDFTIFIVYQKLNSGFAAMINQGKSFGGNGYFNFGVVSADNTNALMFRNTDNDYRFGTNSNAVGAKQLVTVINTGASSEGFVNGVSVGTTANGTRQSSLAVPSELAVGKRAVHSSEYLNGNLSEIIIFKRALTVSERQIVEADILNYYGI